jgi:hypothetical protein
MTGKTLGALLRAGLLSGCGGLPPPRPVDAEQARQTLQQTLDAWKAGEEPSSLQGRKPAVHVADHDWDAGVRLLDYTLAGDQPRGGDLLCRVTLSLENDKGRKYQKAAVYSVGTGSALTVLRGDD